MVAVKKVQTAKKGLKSDIYRCFDFKCLKNKVKKLNEFNFS